jgi:hypothetical protein
MVFMSKKLSKSKNGNMPVPPAIITMVPDS